MAVNRLKEEEKKPTTTTKLQKEKHTNTKCNTSGCCPRNSFRFASSN